MIGRSVLMVAFLILPVGHRVAFINQTDTRVGRGGWILWKATAISQWLGQRIEASISGWEGRGSEVLGCGAPADGGRTALDLATCTEQNPRNLLDRQASVPG